MSFGREIAGHFDSRRRFVPPRDLLVCLRYDTTMFDYLKLYREELSALCGPGEWPLALAKVTYVQGHEDIGRRGPSVSFDPIVGLDVRSWNEAADKAIGGTSLIAPRGGMAVSLHRVAMNMPELLLTTAQLMAIAGTLGRAQKMKIAWRCTLDDIDAISHQPRFAQRGRLYIRFTDDSAIRLMAGMLSAKKARALVEAFHQRTGR